VIFISLSVNPAFRAAFGIFHFATNNISIDCRVSGLIIVANQNFFVKPLRENFCRNFFPAFIGIKGHFSSQRTSIRKCIFIKHCTAQFQHTHELVYGFTVKNLLIALLRVQIELTLHRVYNAACEVVVLHGGRLITYVL